MTFPERFNFGLWNKLPAPGLFKAFENGSTRLLIDRIDLRIVGRHRQHHDRDRILLRFGQFARLRDRLHNEIAQSGIHLGLQPDRQWRRLFKNGGAHLFGASPTYQAILEKAGIVPKDRFALQNLETIVLAGSALMS